MKTMKLSILFALAYALALPVMGATKYGEAIIQKGDLTVLREGQRLVFRPSNVKVAINHEDVIRLGNESSVVLETLEKATLTLGSNAVLQVEPWQRREKKGLMKMLFGRFRATITGLTGAERFNVKTVTATIGVKGTDLTAVQTSSEKTLVWVENSHSKKPVDLDGLFGATQELGVGFASAVVGYNRAVVPVAATPEMKQELGSLNSPVPNSPSAAKMPSSAEGAGLPTQDGGSDNAQGSDGSDADGNSSEDDAQNVVEQVDKTTSSALEELYKANVRIEIK